MDTARIRIWRSALLISLASLGALPACSASKGSSIADGAGGGDGGADGATTDASTKADGSTTTDPTTKDASAAETSTGECSGEATQTGIGPRGGSIGQVFLKPCERGLRVFIAHRIQQRTADAAGKIVRLLPVEPLPDGVVRLVTFVEQGVPQRLGQPRHAALQE